MRRFAKHNMSWFIFNDTIVIKLTFSPKLHVMKWL